MNTKVSIRYKMTVETKNGFKFICEGGRQIIVTLKNDMYEIYAFTLKGTELVKEARMDGVFAQDLQKRIIEVA